MSTKNSMGRSIMAALIIFVLAKLLYESSSVISSMLVGESRAFLSFIVAVMAYFVLEDKITSLF